MCKFVWPVFFYIASSCPQATHDSPAAAPCNADILLSHDGSLAKIADVGLAAVVSHKYVSLAGLRGAFAWAAPEVLTGERHCSEKADIYSLGVRAIKHLGKEVVGVLTQGSEEEEKTDIYGLGVGAIQHMRK